MRRRLVRPKYVLRNAVDAVPVIAPLPPTLQERCLATPSLIAHILVGKYCQHLPLYRQEAFNWSQHRVWLPRQSMSRWVGLAADWLKLIYDHICQHVLDCCCRSRWRLVLRWEKNPARSLRRLRGR